MVNCFEYCTYILQRSNLRPVNEAIINYYEYLYLQLEFTHATATYTDTSHNIQTYQCSTLNNFSNFLVTLSLAALSFCSRGPFLAPVFERGFDCVVDFC